MAQVTIYLDDETLKRVERAAKKTGTSISAWVKGRLVTSLDDDWPAGYFDLLGSLADSDLERPKPSPARDVPRRRL